MISYTKMTILLFMSLLVTIVSCGNKKHKDAKKSDLIFVSNELAGKYKAILRPMNTQVSGLIPSGAAELYATDTKLNVLTYLEDDTKVMHIQDIHEGSRCPNLDDDLNKDGFLDFVEVSKVVGSVLIALDGDLQTHLGGQRDYPKGQAFTYKNETDIENVIHEFSDQARGGIFQFENKVILMHGTSDISKVPESVASVNSLPRNITLPIACGILKRR